MFLDLLLLQPQLCSFFSGRRERGGGADGKYCADEEGEGEGEGEDEGASQVRGLWCIIFVNVSCSNGSNLLS